MNDVKEEKKSSNIVLVIAFILIILVSCGVLYFILTKKDTHDTVVEKPSSKIIFNKENMPRVDASLATQPLMDAYVKNFTGKTVEEMNIEYTNTHPGYVKLINNEADLLIVTQPSEEELMLAKEKNVELEVTKVVNEGFIFFVNTNNKVDSITLDNIRKIYTGEITNWKELGGIDEKIVAYQRPVNSGSQTGLINLVMKDLEIKVPEEKEKIETMEGIIDYVSSYENGLNSIGYSYYYYANEMIKNDNIKYLGINDVKPTYETIQNGTYPILTAYYIVTRKDETNENVLKLKDEMLSKRGQLVAKEAGYVPIK